MPNPRANPRPPRQRREGLAPASPALARALTTLETEMGGREGLLATLEVAPVSKGVRYVVNLIADPANDARDLSVLCAEGNISVGELLQAYKEGAVARGQLQAMRIAGDRMPAVAEDVMRRGAPYEEACNACFGTGSLTPDPTEQVPNPMPAPCTTCAGTGRLRYLPDFNRQKLALELSGLIGTGGMTLNVTQANNQLAAAATGSDGALERLQAATDRVLYDTPLTLDVDAESDTGAE